ncbi:sigma-54-dependent transcriptional regulator [Lepagella muris]|uniref:Sigma-54-dependent Fis family transcriptional regulator n=1 Tax=Lepagella muris TaxID=3032870 RepID=A0AC61RFL1_9BACT|nr:sigma-54 dependent transcriptional regulator [Lepagella muris]TGY77946.1 sigma-54-dependent Fis family transcriptional regulator [Lepagella muris]THG51402.1 sigma-54-dependent Fis family transcriptional regulator [Bacteroidales bacterium]TKC56373.1 sigma-54-dependent Fis family transcriptional regulator [Bacteroidales bacterium]
MILIVDDDTAVRLSLRLLLRSKGYATIEAASPLQALEVVRKTVPRLVLLDMNFSRSTSGEEGIILLREIKIFCPATPVILMTAWGSIPLAVKGVKAGAFDFVTKPWDSISFLQLIKVAIDLNGGTGVGGDAGHFDRSFIIGRSPALLEILSTIERIAHTDASVLIMGENGTGKELIAEAIHRNSLRRNHRLVKVNLGGIASSLFESEMFGHKKGAFTGATSDREGRFALADKGTIFLDEIGDLDLNLQVKLLRVLQEHTYEMLGDSHTRRTDVRVICATNADLPDMVSRKTFREDLFYRINLITVKLPPLRERREDIPLLVNHIVDSVSRERGMPRPEILPGAMEFLSSLPYPGNIRELENLVKRTMLVVDAPRLGKSDFLSQFSGDMPSDELSGQSSIKSLECREIERTIAKAAGNVARAARMLGVTRQTLYRRMEKYGISYRPGE